MSIAGKLRKSLDEKWFMRFKTAHPDGDAYDGVILDIKRTHVVLQEIRDFELQGVIVLPRKIIIGYRDAKFEKCYNEILRKNRQIDKLKEIKWLRECESLAYVAKALRGKSIWPSIEIIYDGEAQFYIGQIDEATDSNFHLRHYTAEGEWDKFYIIDYAWLLRIKFGDNYSKHFNQYMRAKMGDSSHSMP